MGILHLQEDISRYAKELIQAFGTEGYIANLGHGIYPDMDPDNVDAFINAIHRHSKDAIGK